MTTPVLLPYKPVLGRGRRSDCMPVADGMTYNGGSDGSANALSGDLFSYRNYLNGHTWSSGIDASQFPSILHWGNLSQKVFGGSDRSLGHNNNYDLSECFSDADSLETPILPRTSPASSVDTSVPSPSMAIFQNFSRDHSLLLDNAWKTPSPQGQASLWSEGTPILPKAEESGGLNSACYLSKGFFSSATGRYSSTISATDKQPESESSQTVQRHGYPPVQWNSANNPVKNRSSEQFDQGVRLKCNMNGSTRLASSFPYQFQMGSWTEVGKNSSKAVGNDVPNPSFRPSATGESEGYPSTRPPTAANKYSQLGQGLFQTTQYQNTYSPSQWNNGYTRVTSVSPNQFESGIMLNRSTNRSPRQTGNVSPCHLPLSSMKDTDFFQDCAIRPDLCNSKWSLAGGKYCVFCKKNGETREYYTTHVIKDPFGRIICPILRNYICPLCRATGDRAHTISHCPYQSNRRY